MNMLDTIIYFTLQPKGLLHEHATPLTYLAVEIEGRLLPGDGIGGGVSLGGAGIFLP